MDRNMLFAIGGTLGGLLALAAAAFLHRTAPDRQVARRFAVLLVLETVMLWTSRAGPLYWIEPSGLPRPWLLTHFANDGLLIAAYLPALAVLLRTRSLRIFESTRVYGLLIGLAVLNAGVVLVFPELYFRGPELISNPTALARSLEGTGPSGCGGHAPQRKGPHDRLRATVRHLQARRVAVSGPRSLAPHPDRC